VICTLKTYLQNSNTFLFELNQKLYFFFFRSDDGETWKEHTLAYLESRWEGGDDEIYQV
jgi:hypothetical protein